MRAEIVGRTHEGRVVILIDVQTIAGDGVQKRITSIHFFRRDTHRIQRSQHRQRAVRGFVYIRFHILHRVENSLFTRTGKGQKNQNEEKIEVSHRESFIFYKIRKSSRISKMIKHFRQCATINLRLQDCSHKKGHRLPILNWCWTKAGTLNDTPNRQPAPLWRRNPSRSCRSFKIPSFVLELTSTVFQKGIYVFLFVSTNIIKKSHPARG